MVILFHFLYHLDYQKKCRFQSLFVFVLSLILSVSV